MAEYSLMEPPSQKQGVSAVQIPLTHTKMRTRKIHWQVPATLISSLAAGVVFAIVHDRYYHHYDHRPVDSDFQQKVIVNAGTAFAFLVKTFFCISTATAFGQQFWLSLKRKGEGIDSIDTLFEVQENALKFRRITLWARHWMLALLAIIAWCLPIASVFTPGTIHVESHLNFNNDTQLKAAEPQQSWIGTQKYAAVQLDYTATQWIDNVTYQDVLNSGPSSALYSVVLGSLSRQDILPIPAPHDNASYDLSFFGPALNCNRLTGEDFSKFNASLTKAHEAHDLPGASTILGGVEGSDSLVLKYNAWIEGMYYNLSKPNWNNDTEKSVYLPTSANTNYFYFSSSNSQPNNAVLIECHLNNATYNTHFTFEKSQQTINISSVDIHEPVPYNASVAYANSTDEINWSVIVYNAVLAAFNNVVIGAATNDTGTVAPNILYTGWGAPSTTALQQFIEADPSVQLEADEIINILSTMFQNITLSTLASPSLRLSSPEAKAVTMSTWRTVNIYVYEPTDLYIAYGSAFIATLLCVLWGLFVVYSQNHAGYSLTFSTILRTTRGREIDQLVLRDATRGDDPLPSELRSVRLQYRDDGHGPGRFGEGRTSGFDVVHDGYAQGSIKQVGSSNGKLMTTVYT